LKYQAYNEFVELSTNEQEMLILYWCKQIFPKCCKDLSNNRKAEDRAGVEALSSIPSTTKTKRKGRKQESLDP
jgi:hypothetical protein